MTAVCAGDGRAAVPLRVPRPGGPFPGGWAGIIRAGLLVAGGRSRPGERSLVGPLALRTLESLAFDCFIMSIGGVHAEHGWSEFSLEDAAVKQAGLGQAARTVAVADATKLGVRAFSQVALLSAADTFVTDEAAADAGTHPNGPQTLDALREAGVETILT